MSLFDFIKKTNLENLKDRSDLEGLIKVLNRKKDFSLRRQAAKILGEIGDQKAVGSLIKALNDSDPIVRECAVTALGNIGDKKSVSSLIKKLEDEEWSVRWQTVIALGKIREESSIDPLLGMLKDEDENIRSSTANSLVNFGKLSVNPLVELLKNENNFVKKQSIYSLIKRAVDNNKQALQPKFQKFFDLYFVQEKSYHELNQNIITAIKN
ncbi:MAG: HEAT repeat domain-containing protein, partial [Melioribacteraceae bacterium]|nr:HEAT repeat domain-containing protein [Melioribacteraceae bacterium]